MERKTPGDRCSTDLRGESSAIASGAPKINAGKEKYSVSAFRAAAFVASTEENASTTGVTATSASAASAQQASTNR